MGLEVFGCIDVVMHCDEDVKVTLRDLTFVPGAPFDLRSFNVIKEEQVSTLDHTGAHILDGCVLFRRGGWTSTTCTIPSATPTTLCCVRPLFDWASM